MSEGAHELAGALGNPAAAIFPLQYRTVDIGGRIRGEFRLPERDAGK